MAIHDHKVFSTARALARTNLQDELTTSSKRDEERKKVGSYLLLRLVVSVCSFVCVCVRAKRNQKPHAYLYSTCIYRVNGLCATAGASFPDQLLGSAWSLGMQY